MKLEPGQCYFVRTITDYWIGRLVEVGPLHVTLENAAWIASTGRLSDFVKNGKADNMEVEPVGTIMCSLSGSAVLPWPHKLFDKAI